MSQPIPVARPSRYHNGTWQRRPKPDERPFVAWDGEGIDVDGPDRPQHYVLFGSSDTSISPLVSETHLHTFRMLEYIMEVGRNNPFAFHVSYSFGYDANQILRSLPEEALLLIHKTHKLMIRRKGGEAYLIHYIPRKWFRGDTV